MGSTTLIPSKAKMAVPKKMGNFSGLANHGTLPESGRGLSKM